MLVFSCCLVPQDGSVSCLHSSGFPKSSEDSIVYVVIDGPRPSDFSNAQGFQTLKKATELYETVKVCEGALPEGLKGSV